MPPYSRLPEDDQKLRATARQWSYDIRQCGSEEIAATMMYRLLDQLIARLAETTHKILEAELQKGDE